MFKKIILLSVVFVVLLNILRAQEKWDFQIMIGENFLGPINTYMYSKFDADNKLVQLHSSPNADRRIMGSFVSPFLRLFNQVPKKGIILMIHDIEIKHNNDGSDSMSGIFSMPMLGRNNFTGILHNDSISGSFFSKAYNARVYFNGLKTEDEHLGYKHIPKHIFDTTQKYIFNRNYLETRKWHKFQSYLTKLASKANDDLELFFGFGQKSQNLPFSHYYLIFGSLDGKTNTELNPIDQKTTGNVSLKEIACETALLEVTSFGGSAFEMDSVLSIIQAQPYKNLIIDLRDNAGGGIASAHALGHYLIEEELNIGYFISKKGFDSMGDNSIDFESLPVSREKNTNKLLQVLLNVKGCKLMIEPSEKHFNGKIFVLTSNKTASTCEPFVSGLKTNKLATIVGESTAGAMLAGTDFHTVSNIYLFIPIADYYTPEKKRLDKVGVAPDIAVPVDEALDYVIKMIAQSYNEY
ncbi:MAG: S41 family peptidase [Bacteroidales bacterium]|jgi:hypothetical protein|nr:S41 family peptidase [Bacteroidales bacterium]